MSTQTVIVPSGATSVTVDIAVVQNAGATNPGNPLTGLAFNTAGLTCYQRNSPTATPAAVTLATQTVGGAFSAGGLVEIDSAKQPGVYRFDIPDGLIPASGEANFVFTGAANLATHQLKVIPSQQLLLGKIAESYAAPGVSPTAAQSLLAIQQLLMNFNWAGATLTVTKVDGVTTAMTFTANAPANATAMQRTT